MRDARHCNRPHRWLLALALAACVGAIVLALPPSRPAAADAAAQSGATGDTGSPSCPTSNPPNALTLVAGTPQTAQLDSPFQAALQVELANTNGCPVTSSVAGTAITFTAPASGPSGLFSTSGSGAVTVGADASGAAAAGMFTANDTAGSYTITASSAYGSVSFALTNTAAALPSSITALAPPSQSATAGTRYGEPLEVRVLDANGTPVVGAPVTFSLGGSGGGGSASANAGAAASFADGSAQATEKTNSEGIATSPSFTANSTAGTFTATASVEAISEPASFSLKNVAAKALAVKPASATHPTATVGTRYRQPLKVRVVGSSGHPVADTNVTFTLGSATAGSASAASGAAATFAGGQRQATATTNASGIASSPRLTADSVAGTVAATATVPGGARPAQFWLRNRAGTPNRITAGVGARQSTTILTGFPVALAVTVTDAHGNTVAGALVAFTAPGSGPSATFDGQRARRVTIRTDGSGIAVAPRLIANDVAGGYVVTATTGRAQPAAFALVNIERGPPA